MAATNHVAFYADAPYTCCMGLISAPNVLALLFGAILAAVHYASEKIDFPEDYHVDWLMSLTAGVSVTYIFLRLLPELYQNLPFGNILDFVPVLIGFVGFHLAEKYIYQHARRKQLHHELQELHTVGIGLYYFTIGLVLAGLAKQGIDNAALFFIPVMFNAWASSLSFGEIHETMREKGLALFLVSISAFIGAAVSVFFSLPVVLQSSLFGLVVGVLFYTVIRDALPPKRKGHIPWFLAGMAGYGAVIVLLEILL